jgi:hypothetical protein
MARPIEATPVVKGKDGDLFVREARDVVVTTAPREWLESLAKQSKKAETEK